MAGKAPVFIIPAEEEEDEGEREEVATESGMGTEAGAGSTGLGEEEGAEFEDERGVSVERYRSKYRLLELRKDEAPVRQNEVRVTQKVRHGIDTHHCIVLVFTYRTDRYAHIHART